MYKIIGGDGREYGPVSLDQMRQWIAEGRVNAQTQAQAEGGSEWKPLSSFPEIAEALGLTAPPVQVPPPRISVPPSPEPASADIRSYLVAAILCTLFCCLPTGIVTIVYAAQVGSKRSAGDLVGAQDASKSAKLWCWISFGLGLFGTVVWLLFYLLVSGRSIFHRGF